MLRDRLVWGVRDASIQKKLLGESELNLMKAIQLAQSMETAERNLWEIEGGTPKDEGKNQVTRKNTQGQGNENGNCFPCGNSGRTGATCPFREHVCHRCQKRGHLIRMCKQRVPVNLPKGRPTARKGSHGGRGWAMWQVEVSDDLEEDKLAAPLAVVEMRGIKGSYRPPLKVAVKLDTQDVCMNLDTGASVSIMSETKNKQLCPGRSLSPSQIKLQTYSITAANIICTCS